MLVISGVSASEAQDHGVWEVISLDNVDRITLLAEITEPDCAIDGLAFSPDSKLLAWDTWGSSDVSDKGFFVRVWDVTGAQEKFVLDVRPNITDIKFSPDGTRLAVAGLFSVEIWDVETGTLVNTLGFRVEADGMAQQLAFSPDGSQLALAGYKTSHFSSSGTVWRWAWENPSIPHLSDLTYLTSWTISVAYSPDSWILAAGTHRPDSVIQIWNAKSGAAMWVLEGNGWAVRHLAFSPDGSLLVSGNMDGTMRFWDWRRAIATIVIEAHEEYVNGIGFSLDGTIVISAGGDGYVRLWDRMTGHALAAWQAHDRVDELAISPDGTMLATTGGDGYIRLWGVPAES
jgi:WD40 repeat protein